MCVFSHDGAPGATGEGDAEAAGGGGEGERSGAKGLRGERPRGRRPRGGELGHGAGHCGSASGAGVGEGAARLVGRSRGLLRG